MGAWRPPDSIARHIDDEASVWRYLTFDKYVDLVTRGLYLCRLDAFFDPHEGTWPSGLEQVMFVPSDGEVSDAELRGALERERHFTWASCWTFRLDEDQRCWNEYVPGGHGVAVRTSYGALIQALDSVHLDVAVGCVWHHDVCDADWVALHPRCNTLVLPFQKRTAFAWEQEVRVVVQDASHERTGDGIVLDIDLTFLRPLVVLGSGLDESELDHARQLAVDRLTESTLQLSRW